MGDAEQKPRKSLPVPTDDRLVQIFRQVQQTPGLSLVELSHMTGLAVSQVHYAVEALEKARLTRSVKPYKDRRTFENKGKIEMQESVALLRWNLALRVAGLILKHPGVGQKELRVITGTDKMTFRGLMDRLTEAGLVNEIKIGNARRHDCQYHPMPKLATALKVVQAHPIPKSALPN